MLEEAAVLGGDHRLHQVVGQVFELDRVVLQDAALADDVAVAVEEGDGEIRLLAPVGVDRVEGGDGEGEEDQRAERRRANSLPRRTRRTSGAGRPAWKRCMKLQSRS